MNKSRGLAKMLRPFLKPSGGSRRTNDNWMTTMLFNLAQNLSTMNGSQPRSLFAWARISIYRLVSSPISIHWLWTPAGTTQFIGSNLNQQAQQERIEFVQQKAAEICHDW